MNPAILPYAHGRDHDQKRMLELGSVRLTAVPDLGLLRDRFVPACERMAIAAWPGDPTLPLDRAAMSRTLLAVQSELAGTLNSKWAEKARLKVAQVLPEEMSRARRTFFGRLAHLDSRTEAGEPLCLPAELIDAMSEADVAALKAAVKTDGDTLLAEARTLHGKIHASQDLGHLQPREAALVWLFAHGTERFGRPEFGRDERFVAQLHLDPACLRPVYAAYRQLLMDISAAIPGVLATGTPAPFTFSLTPVAAGSNPIPLTASLGPRNLLQALIAEKRAHNVALADAAGGLVVRSLCLEIGLERATLKAVLGHAEPVNGVLVRAADKASASAERKLAGAAAALRVLEECGAETPELAEAREDVDKATVALDRACLRAKTLHGRFAEALDDCASVLGIDPGKRDAVAFCVLDAPHGVNAARALDLGTFSKSGMRAFLSGHALPDGQVCQTGSLSNDPFLGLMMRIAKRIDGLSRAIDARYRRIKVLKGRINEALRRRADLRVPEDVGELDALLAGMAPADVATVRSWHRALFRELARVAVRKAERLAEWARTRGVKKSWFGHLANRIAVTALENESVVALEDATWGIEQKGSENYRGRTWNRLMAAVSPGKLLDAIRAKLDWSGIAWWNVASAYTSQTDHRVAVISEQQRPNGDKVFTALWDGARCDADLHGSETIAATALMRPLDAAGMALRDAVLVGAGARLRVGRREMVKINS